MKVRNFAKIMLEQNYYANNIHLCTSYPFWIHFTIYMKCLCLFSSIFVGVTLSLWANPLNKELCPVSALFVWLLITGLSMGHFYDYLANRSIDMGLISLHGSVSLFLENFSLWVKNPSLHNPLHSSVDGECLPPKKASTQRFNFKWCYIFKFYAWLNLA